ncbi:hypothetical protein EON77_04510 [bacterium]|nr:MAG: hypothetical protein EON77_04510 [bacterium]
MMAVLPAGQRPVWLDTQQEVQVFANATTSTLLRVTDREPSAIGDPVRTRGSKTGDPLVTIATLPLHPRPEADTTTPAATEVAAR